MLIVKNDRAAGGRLIALLITAVMTLVSFDAVAGIAVNEGVVIRNKLVRYDVAAIDNPVQAMKLYSRVRLAAKQVCRRPSDESSNGREATLCEQRAVSEAVMSVNNETFTAIHRARTGVDQPVYNARLG